MKLCFVLFYAVAASKLTREGFVRQSLILAEVFERQVGDTLSLLARMKYLKPSGTEGYEVIYEGIAISMGEFKFNKKRLVALLDRIRIMNADSAFPEDCEKMLRDMSDFMPVFADNLNLTYLMIPDSVESLAVWKRLVKLHWDSWIHVGHSFGWLLVEWDRLSTGRDFVSAQSMELMRVLQGALEELSKVLRFSAPEAMVHHIEENGVMDELRSIGKRGGLIYNHLQRTFVLVSHKANHSNTEPALMKLIVELDLIVTRIQAVCRKMTPDFWIPKSALTLKLSEFEVISDELKKLVPL